MSNSTQGQVKSPEQLNYVGNNSIYHEWTEGVSIAPAKRSDSSVKEQRREALNTAKEKAKDDLRKILAKRGHDFKSARENKKLWRKVKTEYQKRKKEYFQEIVSNRKNNQSNVEKQISNVSSNMKFPLQGITLDKFTSSKASSNNQKSSGKTISLKVPWLSQGMPNDYFAHSWTACFEASKTIAMLGGATILGPEKRIQIATNEGDKGEITEIDSDAAKKGITYIESELQSGRPIMVGVSHKDKYDGNVDDITDHFVVITGQDKDENGKTYYKFHDPAAGNISDGGDSNPKNRFYVNEKGILTKEGLEETGKVKFRKFQVSMIRKSKESELENN